MTVLEKIFPSLRKSEEAQAVKRDLEIATQTHSDITDMFAQSIADMVEKYDKARNELEALKRRRKAQRHATGTITRRQ